MTGDTAQPLSLSTVRTALANTPFFVLLLTYVVQPPNSEPVLQWVSGSRPALLHGLWEPVTGQALSFMFTKDGAMLRGDGFATKFRCIASAICLSRGRQERAS